MQESFCQSFGNQIMNEMGACFSYKIRNQEELERRIVYGLSCEWDNALWLHGTSERKSMRHPLFRLGDLNGKLGSWSAAKREITISRNLVLNHPWDSVREVLLHEMAHQFRDEVLRGADEPPHGPLFHMACNKLRANPKASGSYPTLDERVLRGFEDAQDKLMVKIKKLMALAESRNRHEAESAMAKAHELIAKYNMDFSLRHDTEAVSLSRMTSIFLGRPAMRHMLEQYHLAHLLQDFYFVRGIWVSAFVVEKKKMGRVLEISGYPENIQIASYIFECVNRYIQSQWIQYSREKKISGRQRTAFAIGIIAGFRSKLNGSGNKYQKQIGIKALVEKSSQLMDRYIGLRYPKLVGFKRGGAAFDHATREAGERIGRKLIISHGITQVQKGARKLLPCI
jgi:hypothetical protein